MHDDDAAPETIRLSEYRPPAWLAQRVHLTFDLHPSATRVRARIEFRANSRGERGALRLDGRNLTLISASVDGADVTGKLTQAARLLTLQSTPGTANGDHRSPKHRVPDGFGGPTE